MTIARLPAMTGIVLAAGWLASWPGVHAAQAQAQAEAAADPQFDVAYSREGADTCIKCHDGTDVLVLFKTAHGTRAHPQAPFAAGQLQCESCHGPGGAHAGRVRSGQLRPPVPHFGGNPATPIGAENAACLRCHDGAVSDAWHQGAHERADVGCADCHRVHAARDDVRAADRQAPVCFDCHARQRAEYAKPFHHPVEGNLMSCSGCHGPHGTANEAGLRRATLNDTCYDCHAEKRGPFLWEHAPATEDCSNCHVPHASSTPALLSLRAPLLCQQCHSQAGHPSFAYGPEGLPGGGAPSSYLAAGSCLNCHSQVHGSNHPSGSRLTR